MEDSQIIELYFARDESAIQASREKYEPYCLAVARNILVTQEDAEECVNDTWLRAWNAMPPHRPDRLSAFLGKITRNLALNRWRGSKARRRGEGEMPLALAELGECLAGGQTPKEEMDGKALCEAVTAFLRAQKPLKRIVFVRRYWYLNSIPVIARQFSISESKVKSMLYRMRQELREQLGEEGLL